MTTPDGLISQLLSIREGIPFQGAIIVSSDERESSVDGTVVFQLEEGRLRFRFHVAPEHGNHSPLQVIAHDEGELTLEVPSQDFRRVKGGDKVYLVDGSNAG